MNVNVMRVGSPQKHCTEAGDALTKQESKAMIFRAICFSTHATWAHPHHEQIAFVDAINAIQAEHKLKSILPTLWGVPADSVDCYNVYNEFELAASSVDPSSDRCLFEVGGNGAKPVYCTYDSPLFLVGHLRHVRLIAVWVAILKSSKGQEG